MPCVFPVLGIKILGFVNQAGADRRKVTLHGLVFTSGVLVSFWVLAGILAVLRAGGSHLGWGFQLQSPAFVFGLAAAMLAFALNMSGVFEFGLTATGIGSNLQSKSGLIGSFLTGALATVAATPCAAPFLAPALGAALALSTAQSFAIFTVIGIGLSTPYLLLSAFPAAVKVLPRPGAWMETFKQAMAFPLYATVAYLVWVLAGQLPGHRAPRRALRPRARRHGRLGLRPVERTRRVARRARFGMIACLVLLAAGAWAGWPSRPPPERHRLGEVEPRGRREAPLGEQDRLRGLHGALVRHVPGQQAPGVPERRDPSRLSREEHRDARGGLDQQGRPDHR
jgi:thiol:disulfide interchange protein